MKRSNDQNRKLWAMLNDISRQVLHPQAGRLSAEVWKALALEQMHQEVRWYPSLDGERPVPMAWSSSRLDKKQFVDLVEILYAYGSEKGVDWSDPEWASQQASLARAA